MLSKIKAFFKRISPPWGGPGWDEGFPSTYGDDEDYLKFSLLSQDVVDRMQADPYPEPPVLGAGCCGVPGCEKCGLPVEDKEFYELTDPKGCRIEIYKDKKKEWRWRLLAKNNKVIACAGEGYKRRASMRKSLNIVREVIPFVPVGDE